MSVVSRVCNLRLCDFNELQYNWEKLRRKNESLFYDCSWTDGICFIFFLFFFWDGIEIGKPLVVHIIWQNKMMHCARFNQMIRFDFFKTKKNIMIFDTPIAVPIANKFIESNHLCTVIWTYVHVSVLISQLWIMYGKGYIYMLNNKFTLNYHKSHDARKNQQICTWLQHMVLFSVENEWLVCRWPMFWLY